MITATTNRNPQPVKVHHLVNRGNWWGKTWLVTIQMGFEGLNFVIEADTEQDAIDELADSKYYHLIEDDNENTPEDWRDYAGNESKRVNLDNVYIEQCTVNYFAKKE